MKPVNCLSSQSLAFHAQDAFEAIQANPDNPKVPQFFAERQACLAELDRRGKLRELRAILSVVSDKLKHPLRIRRGICTTEYWQLRQRDAAFHIGFLKRHSNDNQFSRS